MKNNKADFNRRDFIKSLIAVGAGALIKPVGGLGADILSPSTPALAPMPTRVFGKTGVPVSILSLGGILDLTANQLLLKTAITHGVTYWDTAASYNGGRSEMGIGMYLEKNPADRKKIFLVTKAGGGAQYLTQSLTESLEKMRTDYVDMFFMHGISNPRALRDEMKVWAERMKREKKIRFFGFSTHSNMAECLQAAAQTGWIDGIMTAYNYRLTDEMQSAVDACAKAGIGLTAMKTQGKSSDFGIQSGIESNMLERFLQHGFTVEQAHLKAVWENPAFSAVCSQMSNVRTLMSNVAAARDTAKLEQADLDLLRQYAKETCAGYCSGCAGFCSGGAESETSIHDTMRCLMYYHQYGDPDLARSEFNKLPATFRAQLGSMDFTEAERRCPNGLAIGRLMKEAVELLS